MKTPKKSTFAQMIEAAGYILMVVVMIWCFYSFEQWRNENCQSTQAKYPVQKVWVEFHHYLSDYYVSANNQVYSITRNQYAKIETGDLVTVQHNVCPYGFLDAESDELVQP
jgi:hypothetical protein